MHMVPCPLWEHYCAGSVDPGSPMKPKARTLLPFDPLKEIKEGKLCVTTARLATFSMPFACWVGGYAGDAPGEREPASPTALTQCPVFSEYIVFTLYSRLALYSRIIHVFKVPLPCNHHVGSAQPTMRPRSTPSGPCAGVRALRRRRRSFKPSKGGQRSYSVRPPWPPSRLRTLQWDPHRGR